jgi:hypothetical protein
VKLILVVVVEQHQLQSVLDAGSTADSNQTRVNLFEGPLGSKYHQLLINYGGNFSELRLTDNINFIICDTNWTTDRYTIYKWFI